MKNVNKIFLLLFGISILVLISCNNENEDIEIGQVENIENENTPENYINNSCETPAGITCGINGRFKVIPGKKYVYFFCSNLDDLNINWAVQSGLMTITSTNGKYAEIQFESNFNSGIIRVTKIDVNGVLCSVVLEVSKL